jgi:protein-tyrosine phosphatase
VTSSLSARWLDLDGTANTRDLGGTPVEGGRIRPGLLLRSDNLQDLSARDVSYLVEDVGLATVLDLRTPSERESTGPGPLAAQSAVVHLPLSFIPDSVEVQVDPGSVLPARWANGPVSVYNHYLSDRPESFAAAVRRLADPAAGGAIVHCAAGKDRTGVLVAVVLDVLGASMEDIIEDYARTNERIEAIFGRLAASNTYRQDVEKIGLDAHRVEPATMQQVLTALRDEHGSTAAYLATAGVDTTTLERLRDRLVELD